MSQVHDGTGKLVGRTVSVTVHSDEEERRLVEAGKWASGKWIIDCDRLWVAKDTKASNFGFCTWLGSAGSWQVFVLECERKGAEMWSQPDPEVEP